MKPISNDFGEPFRQVTLTLHDGRQISCDWEIASEIAFLNLSGIETISSCSGHGVTSGYIAVREEYTAEMTTIGYRPIHSHSGAICFTPKTKEFTT